MQQARATLSIVMVRKASVPPSVSACLSLRRVKSVFLCCAVSIGLYACGSGTKLPQKSSKEYAEAVSAFYIGLGALQVGDDVHADSKLSELTTLVPGEPAGWANWGVLALRQRKLDVAAQRIERARGLAPDNDQIYQLLGLLESSRGNSANAIADWRKAVEINPRNYRAAYQLAEEVERQADANSDAEYQRLIQKILVAQPDNLAAQLELARVAAKSGDAATLKSMLAQIQFAFRELASRGQSAVVGRASCGRWTESAHCGDTNDFSAQHAHARSGISREPRGVESAAGRRSGTVHSFSCVWKRRILLPRLRTRRLRLP